MSSHLNRILFAAITRRWDVDKIDTYSKSVQQPQETLPGVVSSFQTIDTKASGNLTHVSMMIAGLGLIAPLVATSPVEEGLVVFQILVYLLIALGCLRCLSIFNARELVGTEEQVKQQTHRELIIRHEIYGLCNRATIGFTVFVFFSLPLLWIWNP